MRAKPCITGGLLACVMALPVSAIALGLGRLTVQSGLGQPLSAKIELTAAQKEELDSLRARIADPSVYRDNSVPYVGALARTRVTVEQGPNNVPYLKITSAQAVNEPYLDLIVELSWATGRVVRDYTFLLDPPGAAEMQAAVEPAPPLRAEAAPARPGRPARRAAEAPATPSTAPVAGTYTVKRGDTLSRIAGEFKPDNVTLEQMLAALFRGNESAFDGKNMNRLRSGQIITIPQGDQVAPPSQPEAVKLVKAQAADWRAYRDRVAAGAPASDATGARQAGGGKITTAVEDQASAAQPGRDQLRVSREAGKGGGTGAASAEDAAAKDKALREANSRVAELEKTVRDLQKAAELRNQSMAELQARADAASGKSASTAKTEPAKIETAKIEPAKVEPPKAEAPKVASAAPSGVTPPPVVAPPTVPAPEAKAPETKAPETSALDTKAPPAAPSAAVGPDVKAPDVKADTTAEPKAPVAKTTSVAKKSPEPSFIDDVFGNTPTWAVGGGALVVLAGIAGLIAARRRKTTKFEDSIISGTDIKTNTVFGSTGGGVVNTGDNSLASDFSREGLGNIDTDEVDPIAEAEVYLAYGRDAQAEEILKDALKKDPQRQEIYLKLLEIHAQHNKPSAFETVASELYAVSGGQGEVWHKAMALGRQLDPTNPLFADAAGTAFAGAAAGAAAATASDTQVFSVAPEKSPEPQASTPLDFTLDDDISLSPTSGVVEPKTPAAILAGAAEQVAKSARSASDTARGVHESTIAAAAGTAAGVAAGAAAARREQPASTVHETVSFEPESIPRFDLDFQLDELRKPAPSAAKATASAQASAAPEPALATASSPAPQLARPAAAIELDKLDLAFDPQRSTFEDPTPSVLDGQWHDAATKLDLAKAYQEMGDVEGAREILQEVLHEGDDQQKTEAQGLLSKLA